MKRHLGQRRRDKIRRKILGPRPISLGSQLDFLIKDVLAGSRDTQSPTGVVPPVVE